MWQVKTFRFKSGNKSDIETARKQAQEWKEKNQHRYQIVEVMINNAYGFEYRKLKSI